MTEESFRLRAVDQGDRERPRHRRRLDPLGLPAARALVRAGYLDHRSALASTKSEALEKLYEARANVTSIRWLNETRFAIGLLYLRYLKGQLPLTAVLRQAGDIADAANADSPTCETYFKLLRLLESGDREQRREMEDAARQLLEPQARFVTSELAKLPLSPLG